MKVLFILLSILSMLCLAISVDDAIYSNYQTAFLWFLIGCILLAVIVMMDFEIEDDN